MELVHRANAFEMPGLPSPATQLRMTSSRQDRYALTKAHSAPALQVRDEHGWGADGGGGDDGGGGGGLWQPPPPPVPAFAQGSGTTIALRRLGGRGLLRVVKALLLQRRVVIAGDPAAVVSAAVLGSIACLPCALEGVCGDIGPEEVGDWAQYGLPVRWLDGGFVCGEWTRPA
eukprot:SAG22_NODE_2629_length_2359_cov_10.643805_1_plen_173_part_00